MSGATPNAPNPGSGGVPARAAGASAPGDAARGRAEVAPRDTRSAERSAEAPRLAPRDPAVVRATPTPPSPRSVTEARDRIEATRERLAATAETLKGRVDVERSRLARRLDVSSRIRDAIAGKELWALVGAFAGGLALAWLGRRARLDAEDRAALDAWRRDRERVLEALGLLDDD